MKAVILAAGKGTRMLPLTEQCPKALLPVCKQDTILDLLVQNINHINEIDEVIIVIAQNQYLYFQRWNRYKNIKFIVSPIDNNVIECLDYVINKIGLDNYLIAASDNILMFKIQEFVSFYNKERKLPAVMYYKENSINELKRTGVADIKNNIVVSMVEKPEIPIYDYAIPPFYIIPQSHINYLREFLDTGLRVDSLGSFLSWYSKKTEVRAFCMPDKRYNLGDKTSYIKYIEETSKGEGEEND